MRILLYGGCHARVLQTLFDETFDPSDIEIRHLINFHLIASGEPFPVALLDWCDALVFSPIENKGIYNTDALEAECNSYGVRALAFPWLEWHGYTPGAFKGDFKGRFQWFYPKLSVIAENFGTFEAFYDHVVEHFPDDETIDYYSSDSMARLAASEERHRMAIRVSDFIEDHYRSSRLFLISDHPSLAIYRHVMRQIAECLGIALPSISLTKEPQWRWRTPILPKVRERLGLTFSDTEWIDDEMIPGEAFSLETYLNLYYHRNGVILGPKAATDIRISSDAELQIASVDSATRIFASPIGDDAETAFATYDLLETLSGSDASFPPKTRFAIEPMRWRSTWQF